MYGLLGICLALAALLTINALATLVGAASWRAISRPACGWPAATRARLLFALRIFPATAAIVAVVALFVPSYVVYEPWRTGETVSLKLAALALLSATGLALAIWRGFASWRATRRLIIDWMRHAEPIHIKGVSVPTYRVRHQFPVIAIVGVISPGLFIGSRIFDALNDEELSAAIAHEAGHLAARDNLKRWLMRACRDGLVIVPTGRSLDRAWNEATERAADERAARAGGAHVALDLASALVKIARMIPVGATAAMPAGAYLIGEQIGYGIAGRVLELTRIAETREAHRRSYTKALGVVTWSVFGLFLIVVCLAATNQHVLASLHAGIERIVAALS